MPLLEKALAALNTLTKGDITEPSLSGQAGHGERVSHAGGQAQEGAGPRQPLEED